MIEHLVVSRNSQIGNLIALRLGALATTRRNKYDPLYFDLREGVPLPEAKITFFCSGINGFVACAADPLAAWAVNVEGTVRAATHQVTKGHRVVLLSSCAAETHPYTVYGAFKRHTERAFEEFGDQASIYRFGPVKFPGRATYSNQDYHPIGVPELVEAVSGPFVPGLHKLFNTPK